MPESTRRPTAVFDFDGCLLDTSSIRYLVAGIGKKQYAEFYSRTLECPANYEIVAKAKKHHAAGHAVVILTGRQLAWAPVTLMALMRFGVCYDDAIFRDNNDRRPAAIVKPEKMRLIRARGFEPLWIWDDDPRNVEMWERTEPNAEVTLVPGWDDPIEYPDGWLPSPDEVTA